MDLSKHRERYGKGPDGIRIAALIGLLLMVGGLFAWMQFQGPSDDRGITPSEESIIPSSEENAVVAAEVDPELLRRVVQDETTDQRVVLEQHALLHLLVEANKTVPGDFRRLAAERIDETSYASWVESPDDHRGDPVMTKARLTAIQELKVSTDLDDPNADTQLSYWRLLAADQDGNGYALSTLSEPNVEVGEVIRLEGFFYKVQAMFEGDELLEPFLHLVGKRAMPSFFRWDPVDELSPDMLNAIADYTIEDKAHIEEEPLYHLLSFLEQVDPDELAAVADDVTSPTLRLQPEEYRGKPVRVLGTYFENWGRQLGPDGENPLEWPSIQHGLLVHSGPSFTYLIGRDLKPEFTAGDNENVIAEGVFFKRYLYNARNGDTVECPLIVVRRIVPFRVDASSATNLPAYAIMIIGAILLGWFAISLIGDRKATEDFRERYFKAKRKQVQRHLHSDGTGDA